MNYFSKLGKHNVKDAPGAKNYPIFIDGEAPIKGCNASIGVYHCEEYPTPGVHEDNEGFYVISGQGKAKIGDIESDISEGSCFYAPAGVPHAIKKAPNTPDLVIFLFHFPVS